MFWGGDHKSTLPKSGASFCRSYIIYLDKLQFRRRYSKCLIFQMCASLERKGFCDVYFFFFAQGARFPQASGYWLCKSSIEATQA